VKIACIRFFAVVITGIAIAVLAVNEFCENLEQKDA